MSQLRRATLLLVAAVIAGTVLGGCGFLRRNAEPTPIPPVELELVSFDSASWAAAESLLIQEYQEGQPNVTFNRSTYAQSPTAYLSQSPAPDLMVISPGYLLDKAAYEQQLMDLTDLWEQSGLLDQYPASFRELSASEGKQFYLPVAYTWTAIYYNQETFAAYGLESPTTWDEFVTVCDTLLANGVTPLSVAGSDFFLSTLWLDYLDLRLNGLEFHRQLTNGQVSFEDERFRSVLELWSWMLDRGYFMEHPERMSATDSLMAIVSDPSGLIAGDKAAMTLTGPTWLGNIPAPLRSGLDFFAFPTIDPSIPTAEVLTAYGYMIPNNAVNRETALSFVELAGSAEAQKNMIPQLNTSAADVAPANPGADTSQLSDTVQHGAAIVIGAAGVAPFFVLAVPDSMWGPVGQTLAYFLQNPWDIEGVATRLEEARQNALAAGHFLEED